MAKTKKSFTEYLRGAAGTGAREYFHSPVSTFFAQILDISDSYALCLRRFPKKNNGHYTVAARHSHQQLSAACLCTIMGHFELYQRFTFAGLVEHSVHLIGFDIRSAVKRLQSDFAFQINPAHLLAYRSRSTAVGELLVDNLPGWHDPARVNKYFKAFRQKMNFYSNDQVLDLDTLWQLRHTMSHTGGWLSVPDAQKVAQLRKFSDQALYFKPQFIEAVIRRFHKIVPDCAGRLKTAVDADVSPQFSRSKEYQDFFSVVSQRPSWL